MNKINNGHKGIKYDSKEHLFLTFIWHYDGSFTYCSEMKHWMQNDKELQLSKSVEDFKQRMELDPYYDKRHFQKVDSAFEHFEDLLDEWDVQLPASVDDMYP